MRRALGLVVWVSAAGCAPIAGLRPLSRPLRAGDTTLGIGAARVGPRPFVDEPSAAVAQAWATRALSGAARVSIITALDADAFAGGVALAVVPFQRAGASAGLELELGYAWAAVSVPLAARVTPDLWLYSGPRLGTWGTDALPSVPLGLDVRLSPRASALAEVGLSWQDFDPNARRTTIALGLGVTLEPSAHE